MDCKETEKLIPDFLEDELETEDLREFMEHMNECRECREELSIQFLVKEGLARLESGSVFDLNRELKGRLENADHDLKVRENMKRLLHALEGLVVVALITLAALLVFF